MEITLDFVKETKNFRLYQERGGINKWYLPKEGVLEPVVTFRKVGAQ